MKRVLFATAAAVAPLLLAMVEPAWAATEITTSTTTPVATATANNGAPDNVDIASGGSINPTASGAALTLNSSNTVSSEGSISFSNVDNATGILVLGGNTGSVNNTGAINIGETYVAPVNSLTGLAYGAWASGGNRYGIAVEGPGTFTGGITETGAITIQGNSSYGMLLDAPITGNLTMLTVTPASGSTAATVQNGSITVTGNDVIGLYVTKNGGVGGDIRVTGTTARGINAQGVVIDGNVGGGVNISAGVSATGYRSTTRPSSPGLSTQYTADQLEQGGAAVSIGANIGQGLIISAPPFPTSTTNLDLDGDGVPDTLQGTGAVTSYGSAPALQIGAVGRSVELGPVNLSTGGYGLVIQGSVSANGVYDPLITPTLPSVVPATAIQIGIANGGPVMLDVGLHNTGSISATAYQADSTAIHVGANATAPTLANDGTILATSTQVNSATTPTPVIIGVGPGTITIPTPLPVNVTGVLIDSGANVPTLSNSKLIAAILTGAGGVGGTVSAIVDNSGSLAKVENTGNITATLNQTFVATPIVGTTTAIDISHGIGAQTISQDLAPGVAGAQPYNSANSYAIGATASLSTTTTDSSGVTTTSIEVYKAIAAVTPGQDPGSNPSLWQAIGTQTPSIVGDIHFGSHGANLNVSAGSIAAGTIDLGSGVNTLTVNGAAPSTVNGIAMPGTVVTGAIKDSGNYTLTVNVMAGTLSDTNTAVIKANSINVGANGILLVAADPVNNANTLFLTSGVSTFASGAQLGLTLQSVQIAPSRVYTIVQTIPGGTLTAGTFGTGFLNNAPYLYTAAPSYVAATGGQPGEIQLTVTRRTPAQLNFNASEAGALDAVLNAIPNDANIEKVVLAQTTEAGLKSAYDQLLPDQGQGIFESLDAAAQAISSMTGTTPDAGTRVPGTSLWLQEVNERVDRSGITSLGSQSQLLGIVAGAERAGAAGGAIGATLSYMNAQEEVNGGAVGEHVVGSLVEGGLYYRRADGPLTVSARGGAGYAWFNDVRRFLAPGAVNNANSDWGAYFVDAHAGAAYEIRLGRYYVRPQLSLDYLRLAENGHSETGGGAGFDLTYASRTSTRFSGQAEMVLGEQWGKVAWLRTEIRAGYREIFAGNVGDTVANFEGGSPFALAADPDQGGWATVGFSIKGGTPYSYVALEGDADFRAGEQRYDLRVAGRSMF